MEISEIKKRLPIETVLGRYQLTPDHNHRLKCPFHDDKTPSLQVYPETGTWTCFSSNCSAGSGDQIDFIMKYEKISKHEAILKAKSLLGSDNVKPSSPVKKPELIITSNDPETLSRIAVLTKIFSSFQNGMLRSQPGRQYAVSRGLDPDKLDIGFNSGQYHHNGKVSDLLMKSFIKHGLLKPIGKGTHQVFGKNCICFALKNPAGQVTGLYFRSIFETNGNTDQSRHFYLKDRQGLYPVYPKPGTTKLILTEAIIDAATLLQMEEITKAYGILSLYGTNGLTDEHKKAIGDLKELQEIILFFDGDQAGREAVKKHSETLHTLKPDIKISFVETPDGHDINSLYTSHEKEVFTHLLHARKSFSFSIETLSSEKKSEPVQDGSLPAGSTDQSGKLDSSNPYNLLYIGEIARYSIRGGLRSDMDSLKVSIVIESLKQAGPYMKYRNKADLYENRQVEKIAREASDKLDVRSDLIELDMHRLTDLLEDYRDSLYAKGREGERHPVIKADPAMISRCREFLSGPDLIQRLNRVIGESGVVGEETNRMFLFIIATSYKMPDTLHALIQGSTGSGKTHLLDRVSRLMPPEDVKRFTRVTDSSFYNYGAYDLQNKLICLEDLDGMKEEAQLAFRELQSREMLSTSTTGQDEKGNLRSYEKVVYGPIASLSCTTRGDVYEDNMSRCFVIAVDETMEQTGRVISYQNRRASGAIDPGREQERVLMLQNCIRLLKPYPVINPYADKVHLPQEAHKIRRLNELYQSFVRQVTLVHQYRRDKDSRGRLITRKEDLLVAADIMFESILLKIDELDGGLRQFYERLKDYVKAMGGDHPGTYCFGQREVRMALNVSKSQLQRYIYDLRGLEYIVLSDGHINRGYRYRIIYWDDITRIRARLKRHLEGQLAQLELMTANS
jgi:DNA primase catalytic core